MLSTSRLTTFLIVLLCASANRLIFNQPSQCENLVGANNNQLGAESKNTQQITSISAL